MLWIFKSTTHQPLKTGSIHSYFPIPVISLVSHLGVKNLFHNTSRRMMNVFTLQRPTYSHQVGLQNKFCFHVRRIRSGLFYEASTELDEVDNLLYQFHLIFSSSLYFWLLQKLNRNVWAQGTSVPGNVPSCLSQFFLLFFFIFYSILSRTTPPLGQSEDKKKKKKKKCLRENWISNKWWLHQVISWRLWVLKVI